MLLGQKLSHSSVAHQIGTKMKAHYNMGSKINNSINNGKSLINHIFNIPSQKHKSILER